MSQTFSVPNYQTFSNNIKTDNEIVESFADTLEQEASLETNHCHSTTEASGVDKVARRKLLIASSLCLVFMIAEIVGGTLANSLAIMTDAAHLLSDFASFMISLFAIYLASRPATKRMSFGWHRAEVVGALVSVLLIWVVTGVLVFMAVIRVKDGEYEINASVMLITSGAGVIINVIMACSLHQHSHGHGHGHGQGHGHGHDYNNKKMSSDYDIENSPSNVTEILLEKSYNDDTTDLVTEVRLKAKVKTEKAHKSITNINVRAAFIHVIGDLIQSVGVLVAAFLIYYKPSWKIADPICTFVFSLLVLFTTINILRDAMNVLMEGTPKSLDFDEVKNTLLKIEGVCLLHNLRLWSLTMNKTALSVHLAIDPTKDVHIVLKNASRILMSRYKISDATIQVENYVADMDDCKKCQAPKS